MSMLLNTFRFGAPAISWTAATVPTYNQDVANWSGYTLRQLIKSGMIPANGNYMRFSISDSTAGEGAYIAKCYIGKKGTGTFDFATTPTQVTWNNGSPSVTVVATATTFCDPISLPVTTSDNIVIAFYMNDPLNDTLQRCNTASANYDSAYTNSDDVTTLVASGYATEGCIYPSGFQVGN